MKIFADVLALFAVCIIVLSGTRYNDLYHTCYSQAYHLLKGKTTDQLSYGEFYSAELFEEAKQDLGYKGNGLRHMDFTLLLWNIMVFPL